MKNSSFQFTNPILLELQFEVNKSFDANANNGINIPTNFNINISKKNDAAEAIVELTVTLGAQDNNMPFYVKAVEGAKFLWENDSGLNIDQMLEQNAPALLLGYLRPIIASITSASPFTAYNIPFVNFTE